jgi:hypothetical protein
MTTEFEVGVHDLDHVRYRDSVDADDALIRY